MTATVLKGATRFPCANSGDAAWLASAMHRVKRGDASAFALVYQRTATKLFRICRRILPAFDEAEDVLQETYLIIWRQAAHYDETRGAAMTWMIAIARNRAIDRLRRSGRISARMVMAPIENADHIADRHPLPCQIMETDQDLRKLSTSLQALAPLDAMLIRAAFLEGSTHAELAKLTGMPLSTVKSRIRRALPKLRSHFPLI